MNNSPIFGTNPYYPYQQTPIVPQIPYMSNNNLKSIIPGRSVMNQSEITAEEVPLNGSLAVFPKADGSAVYVRSYNGDGTIKNRIYIPAPDDYEEYDEKTEPVASNDDIMESIKNLTVQVNDLQATVDGLTKNNHNNNQNKNNNKQQNQKGNPNA